MRAPRDLDGDAIERVWLPAIAFANIGVRRTGLGLPLAMTQVALVALEQLRRVGLGRSDERNHDQRCEETRRDCATEMESHASIVRILAP